MNCFNAQKPRPWIALIVYTPQTESASVYIDTNTAALLKYSFNDPNKTSIETVYSSIAAIRVRLLTKKGVDDIPFFSEYKITHRVGQILLARLGETSIVRKTRELDWLLAKFNEVGIDVNINELKPEKYLSCMPL